MRNKNWTSWKSSACLQQALTFNSRWSGQVGMSVLEVLLSLCMLIFVAFASFSLEIQGLHWHARLMKSYSNFKEKYDWKIQEIEDGECQVNSSIPSRTILYCTKNSSDSEIVFLIE